MDDLDWTPFNEDMKAQIRARLIIADLLPDVGAVEGREQGKWSCPVCGSSDGLQLYKRENRTHCYAAGCSKRVDAIDIARAALGLGFVEALEWCARRAGIDYDAERDAFLGRDPRATWTPRTLPLPAAPVRPARRGAPRFEQLAADFEQRGHDRPDAEQLATRTLKDEARAALVWARSQVRELESWAASWLEQERGLDPEMCVAFGLVSCTAARWREVVNAAAERFGEDVVKVAGIMRADEGEHYRAGDPFPRVPRFIILPNVIDGGAALDALRFRNPAPSSPHLKALALLNGEALAPGLSWALERPYLETWALEMARAHNLPLYVCEGELDALSMWQAGRPALAAPGAKSWRAGWCASWAGLSRVIIVADQDKGAGAQLAKEIGAAALRELGDEEARRIVAGARIPAARGFKDANDLLRAGLLGAFINECEGC